MRVELVARHPANVDLPEFWKSIQEVDGIVDVLPHEPREQGPNLVTFEVQMNKDVRESVVAFLVKHGFGVLQLSKSHRELENVFLQLSESGHAMTASVNTSGDHGEVAL
jgi:phosphate uptake regulator